MKFTCTRQTYIWGAGKCGADVYANLEDNGCIQGFIDSDEKKWGAGLHDKIIYSPQILAEKLEDKKPYIIIASTWWNEIEEKLNQFGYSSGNDYVHYFNVYSYPNDWEKHRNRLHELSLNFAERIPQSELKQFDDEFWFWMNTIGYRENDLIKKTLSPLPDDKIQIRLTGVAGDTSLRHAFNQYIIIKELLGRSGKSISDFDNILDFGCGYGRLLRFFVKDAQDNSLYGTDISEELVQWSRENNRFGQFFENNAFPPTQFQKGQFSFVFAFSVFTHLSENSHLVWMEEMGRIIKSGGLMIFTIWAHPKATRNYHAPHFLDYEKLIRDYENQKFSYSNYLYNGSETYGEALVPVSYIKEKWNEYFEMIDYVEEHPNSPTQNYVVLRRK